MTILMTWNPSRNELDGLLHDSCVSATAHAVAVAESWHRPYDPARDAVTVTAAWSTGNRVNNIDIGDRVYLLMVGDYGRGIVRSGRVVSEVFFDDYYNSPDIDNPTATPYVRVAWDLAVPEDDPLPTTALQSATDALVRQGRCLEKKWRYVQRGGDELDPSLAAKIERMWLSHVRRHYAHSFTV